MKNNKFRFVFVSLLLLVLFNLFFSVGTSLAEDDFDSSLVTGRINSFKEFEAEELINYGQLQKFLKSAEDDIADWQHRFQQISVAERSSLASPVQRKRLKVSLGNLAEDSDRFMEELTQAREDCSARLEILKSFDRGWNSVPKGIPDEILSLISTSSKERWRLRANTEKQIMKIDYLLKLGKRLQGRIEKLELGEKNNLFQIWTNWLIAGKDPVFTSDFWKKLFPGTSWLDLKVAELRVASKKMEAEIPLFLLLFIVLSAAGLFLIRLMDRSDYFQNRSEIERRKSLHLLSSACVSFSLYATIKTVFPDSMDSLAVIAFGVFFWAVIKLSKLICREKVSFVSGEVRSALLFVTSGLLLVQQVPGRMVIAVLLLLLLSFGAYSTYRAWRRSRLKGVSSSAKKNSLFLPLFVLAIFGYGRLACVLALLCSLAIFIRGFGSVWTQILFVRTEMSVLLKKGLVRTLAVPAGWAIAFGIAAFWISDFFGRSAVTSALELSFTHKDYSISLSSIVWLAIFFFMTKQCVSAFNVSIEHVGSKWPKAKRGAVPSIQTLFTYAVWSLFALICLNVLGLSLTSITVIAGGLSVGIGFGLQNIVNNFIGGLILLFGRSIQQGDIVELNGLWCTVKKINIRTTLVETFENAVIMIPNSDLVAAQVTNWTKNNAVIRRDILVGVAYGSDVEKVREVLHGIAEEHPHVLQNPAPYVHFSDFGASSLDFILRVWIDDLDFSIRVQSELRFEINRRFKENDIEIAFPQLDLHVKSTPAVAKFMNEGGSI